MLAGITTAFDTGVPFAAMIPMIAEAGFKAVSLSSVKSHLNYESRGIQKQASSLTSRYGLVIESIHAAWQAEIGVLDEAQRRHEVNEIMAAILAARAMGIEMVIVHAGWGSPSDEIHARMTSAALGSMAELSDCALKNDVKLAVENLQGPRSRMLTRSILKAFPQPHIGFCHDTGHEHCTLDCFKALEECGGRLCATHVHDDTGHGQDDHLLPYEGTINWGRYVELMKKIDYAGVLLIEAVKNKQDGFRSTAEFLREAKKRADGLMAAIRSGPSLCPDSR